MAARISHPNVIPIYEVGLYGKTPLLVFEFVEGMTLKQHLREHGRFDEKEALSIMAGIAAGLSCAHEQGIMHLDISPNNIMVDKQGRSRIMDFGLARVTVAMDESQQDQRVFGTPRYITPEHLSRQELTCATDIFSLGLVFYELLVGTPAIDGKNIHDIYKAVENADID